MFKNQNRFTQKKKTEFGALEVKDQNMNCEYMVNLDLRNCKKELKVFQTNE